MRALSALLLSFLLTAGAGAYFFWNYSNTPASDVRRDVVVDIKSGTLAAVAKRLADVGLIQKPKFFVWLIQLRGLSSRIRAGEFRFHSAMTPLEVLEVLVEGKSVLHPLTVREGDNIFEIAQNIENLGLASAQQFLEQARNRVLTNEIIGQDLESFEGYLFPETYHFVRDTSVRKIISTMVSMFNSKTDISAKQSVDGLNLTRHQLVVLASMIEKETGAPEERPIIASVFFNRLRKKMKLQSDPTIMYGLRFDLGLNVNNITKEHLRWENRFSTYSAPALPAGPIGNPGVEALRSAQNPAKTDFLYFVSRNDGTHVFSANFEGHNQAVKEFQLNRRAREGKSWRDRLKK